VGREEQGWEKRRKEGATWEKKENDSRWMIYMRLAGTHKANDHLRADFMGVVIVHWLRTIHSMDNR
jgi:hypothetical protein